MEELGPDKSSDVRWAPKTLRSRLLFVGPGLMIAAGVVGSGELVGTTKVGALAGYMLLWLIIIGCVVKTPIQIELARYAISTGQGTMALLAGLRGPRIMRLNLVMWFWLIMMVAVIIQLGGIVHGVGQSAAIALPLTGDYNELLAAQDSWDAAAVQSGMDSMLESRPTGFTWDDVIWATLATALTMLLLVRGRYRLIERMAMILVGLFTLATLFCLAALQLQAEWAISWADIGSGLSFRIPPVVEGLTRSPVAAVLATFGIIGMAATDLIAYPYFCVEKGYAKWTGKRDDSDVWAKRARGWLDVMRLDAFAAAAAFTIGTVAFYLLGASVLHPQGLDPVGEQMIPTLAKTYQPVYGTLGVWLFLMGAIAVLYSTLFVSPAGHARVCADALRVAGVGAKTDETKDWWVRQFSWLFPLIGLVSMLIIRRPVFLILAAGIFQSMMLPIVAVVAVAFRYRTCDKRILPGRAWDVLLVTCVLILVVMGVWAVGDRILDVF